MLQNKKLLITGILTDKSIAYHAAKIAIDNGLIALDELA